jgi:hypothetical protein
MAEQVARRTASTPSLIGIEEIGQDRSTERADQADNEPDPAAGGHPARR